MKGGDRNGKARRRTILKRKSLERIIFEKAEPVLQKIEDKPEPAAFDFSESYSTMEVREKYNISESALRDLIIKHKIPKLRKGWFAFVPKNIIDKLLT